MASPGALFAICAAMMTAMMLPGALLQIARRGVLFGAGYLLVWTGFSAVATLVQVELDRAGLLSEAMALRSVPLAALVVAAAGLYQFAPSKRACLARCRIQGAENIGMAPGCSHHNRRWRALRLLVRELLLGADGAALRGRHDEHCLACGDHGFRCDRENGPSRRRHFEARGRSARCRRRRHTAGTMTEAVSVRYLHNRTRIAQSQRKSATTRG